MTDAVIERPTDPSVVIGLARKAKACPNDCAPSGENVSVSKLNFHCEDSNHALGYDFVPIYAKRVTGFVGP